jgi:hypothetical protein
MTHQTFEHHFHTVVVGGGQAALAISYFAKGGKGRAGQDRPLRGS